jgi:hypothetical protein
MKTIGRILIILVVFSMVTGLIVTAVNASGKNAPDFDGVPQFRPGGEGGEFSPEGVENRPERGGGDNGLPRWLFGAVKNVAVIGFLVTVIVWPKSIAKNKKKSAAVFPANGKS